MRAARPASEASLRSMQRCWTLATPSSSLSTSHRPAPNTHKLSLRHVSLLWLSGRKRMETFWLRDIKLTLTGTDGPGGSWRAVCDRLSLPVSSSECFLKSVSHGVSENITEFISNTVDNKLLSHQNNVTPWTMMSLGSSFCQFSKRQDGKWYWGHRESLFK